MRPNIPKLGELLLNRFCFVLSKINTQMSDNFEQFFSHKTGEKLWQLSEFTVLMTMAIKL